MIAVCPGPVETEFFAVAQKNEFMKDKGGETEPANRALFASSRDVVAKALADLDKGKRHSIFGFSMKLFASAAALAPLWLKLRVMARKNTGK